MLLEIASYKYESFGFPNIFLSFSPTFKSWGVAWRNPVKFNNSDFAEGTTPSEACEIALRFIKDNPELFTKKP